ncbi:YARHG domain-containing protein [Haloimpatiens sp. FM7330]|uniref:YARHG domain-containing protein n=1 Tax=Haloimpatiens sp. FM7330 TaxID=3298610 RepID=UPI0036269452
MFCRKCGTENKDESKFCRKCGERLNGSQNIQNDDDDNNNTSSIGENKFLVIMIIVLAAIIAFGGGYLWFSNMNKPKEVKDNQTITTKSQDKSNKREESKKDNLKDSDKDGEVTKEDKNTDDVVTNEEADDSSNLYNFNCPDNEYVCPALSETYLKAEDFSKLDKHQIQLLINEIYAKYGYKFTEKQWVDYFSNKTWYIGVKSYVEESEFNDFELKNIKVLNSIRKAK